MSRQTPAERTVAAECRSIEEGHQARRAGDGRHFLVRSESVEGRDYYVRVVAGPDVVLFSCDHRTFLLCSGQTSARGDGDYSICRRCGQRVATTDGFLPPHPVTLDPERSFVPCKHGARAAHRLEREGLLRWAGDRWRATDKAVGLAPPQPADPFEGLPK